MYLVLFLDQQRNYEFNVSLHSTLPKAEAAYEALLRRFGVKACDLDGGPPSGEGWSLCDYCGEAPHIYRIECDDKPGEEISVSDIKLEAMLGLPWRSSSNNDTDATA